MLAFKSSITDPVTCRVQTDVLFSVKNDTSQRWYDFFGYNKKSPGNRYLQDMILKAKLLLSKQDSYWIKQAWHTYSMVLCTLCPAGVRCVGRCYWPAGTELEVLTSWSSFCVWLRPGTDDISIFKRLRALQKTERLSFTKFWEFYKKTERLRALQSFYIRL